MNKGRRVGGVLRTVGRALAPTPSGALTHHSLTRTHSGKRLHAGGSGMAARPLGAIQAPGAEAFWGNCRSVERFGVLHGEVGGPARAGQESGRWEYRQSTWRTGSESQSSVCLVTLGGRFQPVAHPLVRVPGVGSGQRWNGKPRQPKTDVTKGRVDPRPNLLPSAFASNAHLTALRPLPPGSLP